MRDWLVKDGFVLIVKCSLVLNDRAFNTCSMNEALLVSTARILLCKLMKSAKARRPQTKRAALKGKNAGVRKMEIAISSANANIRFLRSFFWCILCAISIARTDEMHIAPCKRDAVGPQLVTNSCKTDFGKFPLMSSALTFHNSKAKKVKADWSYMSVTASKGDKVWGTVSNMIMLPRWILLLFSNSQLNMVQMAEMTLTRGDGTHRNFRNASPSNPTIQNSQPQVDLFRTLSRFPIMNLLRDVRKF